MAAVQLYVYDLSNGMAASMSRQLTGKYIEGIWHTSVVCHGVEVFFGQGISIVSPGSSHHGRPLKIIPMGNTGIDKETFMDYIQDLRQMYSAEKYHLLEFNCNTFSNDVVGFLTGGTIPQDIIDLPAEFLSTPFGQSLRPMIENMYRQPGNGPGASQAVNALTSGAANAQTMPQSSNLISGLSICTNLASFESLLASNTCLVVMFTRSGCPPCTTIKPIFEDLAFKYSTNDTSKKGQPQKAAAFALVDTGMAGPVANRCEIKVTPTFLFLLGGKEVHRMQGSNETELKSQVNLLLYTAYPPHKHSALKLKALPQLAKATVVFDAPLPPAAVSKLSASLEKLPKELVASALDTLNTVIKPVLSQSPRSLSRDQISRWNAANQIFIEQLPDKERFPAIDILRYACLDSATAIAMLPTLKRLLQAYQTSDFGELQRFDTTLMLELRLLTNALDSVYDSNRDALTKAAIEGLLSQSTNVRTAAASLAFKMSQKHFSQRCVWTDASNNEATIDEAWETELVSALVEALRNEPDGNVCHRIIAALGLLLYFSPNSESLSSLTEVFGTREVLKQSEAKLPKDGNAVLQEVDRLLVS